VKRVVLLDWGGTLCQAGAFTDLVDAAAARLNRAVDAQAILDALLAQERDKPLRNPMRDTSVEAGRAANMEELRGVGIDDDLAGAICDREAEADFYTPYPDTRALLEAIGDLRTVVISNCCVDIRENFAHHGLDQLIDDYVLSCEHGIVKPDRRLFELALGEIDPADALMVGDSSADAGAIQLGIETILLPAARGVDHPRGFDTVLRAIGIP
jgi:HAD superfamily hydrolase (TIGR01549 family)